jgi:hypothetical protein
LPQCKWEKIALKSRNSKVLMIWRSCFVAERWCSKFKRFSPVFVFRRCVVSIHTWSSSIICTNSMFKIGKGSV